MPKEEALVRLYPTTDASVPGVAAEVQDVTPARAKELLAYQPPAFTTRPPTTVDDQQGHPPDSD